MKRLLLVQARSENLSVLRADAAGAGYELLAVTSGQRGLQALASQKFDGVLLDSDLPGEDAAHVQRQFHRLMPGLPVLLFRGRAEMSPLRFLDAFIRNPESPELIMARS